MWAISNSATASANSIWRKTALTKGIRPLFVAVLCAFASACSTPVGNLLRPGFGAIVHYESVPWASEKYGLNAVSDQGARLFGPYTLQVPPKLGFGGGTSTFVGAAVPQWVRVTWREETYRTYISRHTGRPKTVREFGEIIGDHTVQVASRIPAATLRYASNGKGRAIFLIFRILDDRVLFSWAVQETVFDPDNGGTGYVYSLYSGDLSCDDPGGLIQRVSCTSGNLKDAPWYSPRWKFI